MTNTGLFILAYFIDPFYPLFSFPEKSNINIYKI